jgi:hypothetical protein
MSPSVSWSNKEAVMKATSASMTIATIIPRNFEFFPDGFVGRREERAAVVDEVEEKELLLAAQAVERGSTVRRKK